MIFNINYYKNMIFNKSKKFIKKIEYYFKYNCTIVNILRDEKPFIVFKISISLLFIILTPLFYVFSNFEWFKLSLLIFHYIGFKFIINNLNNKV